MKRHQKRGGREKKKKGGGGAERQRVREGWRVFTSRLTVNILQYRSDVNKRLAAGMLRRIKIPQKNYGDEGQVSKHKYFFYKTHTKLSRAGTCMAQRSATSAEASLI